jgi:hypothetical protein
VDAAGDSAGDNSLFFHEDLPFSLHLSLQEIRLCPLGIGIGIKSFTHFRARFLMKDRLFCKIDVSNAFVVVIAQKVPRIIK